MDQWIESLLLNLYLNGSVASGFFLTTRSLDLACFMTSGKVVSSDFAVSHWHVYNFLLVSLKILRWTAGEIKMYSLTSLQILC